VPVPVIGPPVIGAVVEIEVTVPPLPVADIVKVSVESLVVIVTPVPATIVSVSVAVSATMLVWVATAIVVNELLAFPLNVFQSVELKNPLVETPDCATCIDVPAPITAPVPPVMVRTAEVASVRFPFVSAGSLLLNVVQSVEDRAPLLVADAVGTCNVMTGVVVPFATVLDKSVPVVPKVRAATLVTVPTN
jgi:hypothetical protein